MPNISQGGAVHIRDAGQRKTLYQWGKNASGALSDFVLQVLLLLAAYGMARTVFPVELAPRHWIAIGTFAAASALFYGLMLTPAMTGMAHRWKRAALRTGVSGAFAYAACRVFILFYLAHRLDIEDGLLSLGEPYIRAYNAYFHTSIGLSPGKEEYAAYAAVFCILAAAAVQCLLWQLTGVRAFLLLLPAGVFVSELWVGLVPDAKSLFLFSVAVVYLAVERSGMWRTRVLAVLLWSLLFIVSAAVFQSPAERLIANAPEYKEYQKKLEAAAKNLASANLWGVRETVTNDAPVFSDKEILTISATEQPTGNLYLKSFVGTSYENGGWTEDTRAFSSACKEQGIDVDTLNDRLWNTSIRDVEGNVWGFRETDYTLRYVYNPQSYALLPYFTDLDGLGEVSVVGDQKLKVKRGTKELTVHGTAWNDSGYAHRVMQCLYRANDISDENWDDWYRVYVKAQYLGTSGEVEAAGSSFRIRWNIKYLGTSEAVEAAGRLTKELPGNYKDMLTLAETDRNEWRVYVAEKVAEYLDENYTYSWDLDDITDGTDAVQYFLETGKKGYCMHFATAGTLMLRELGIPARYVAGYVVKEGAFSRDENGDYTATVYDRNAHAWTEIYLDNYGWVPIEMTPGFSGDGSALPTDKTDTEEQEGAQQTEGTEQASEETGQAGEDSEVADTEETPEDSPADTETVVENAEPDTGTEDDTESLFAEDGAAEDAGAGDTAPDASESGWADGRTPGKLLFVVVIVLAVAVAVPALAVGIFRLIRKRIRAYRDYPGFEIRRKHYRGAVRCINRRIYRRLCRRTGRRGAHLKDLEYGRLLAQTYGQIPPEQWGNYMEIAKKAAFSGEVVTEQDAVFCYGIYRAL